MVSDDVYRRVGREVLSGNLHPATWAKALAECAGGHDEAVAVYARMRSKELTRQVECEAEKKQKLACRVARAYRETEELPSMEPIILDHPGGLRNALDAIFWHCVAIVGAVGCLLAAQLAWPEVAAHLGVEKIILIVLAFQLIPTIGWVAAGRNGFYSALSYSQATHISACVAVIASFVLGGYLLVGGPKSAAVEPEQLPKPLLVVVPEDEVVRPVVHVEEVRGEPVSLVASDEEE